MLNYYMWLVVTLLDSSVLEYKNAWEWQLHEGRSVSAVFPAVASASLTVSGARSVLRK